MRARAAICALAGLLAACQPKDDARGEAEPSYPAAEPQTTTVFASSPTQEPAADPSPAAPPPERPAPAAREPEPYAPPDLSREPVDLEEVLIVGARGGETLGEYRARADRAFDRLDLDRDGRLEETEILSGVRQGRFGAALDEADVDLDQAVSRQEFGDLVTRSFQRLDADGNGMISEAELEAGDLLAD